EQQETDVQHGSSLLPKTNRPTCRPAQVGRFRLGGGGKGSTRRGHQCGKEVFRRIGPRARTGGPGLQVRCANGATAGGREVEHSVLRCWKRLAPVFGGRQRYERPSPLSIVRCYCPAAVSTVSMNPFFPACMWMTSRPFSSRTRSMAPVESASSRTRFRPNSSFTLMLAPCSSARI